MSMALGVLYEVRQYCMYGFFLKEFPVTLSFVL